LRRIAPRLTVSLLIAIGFAWALGRGGLPFSPPEHTAHWLRWWGPLGFALCGAVAAFFRTRRWVYLLRPLAPGLNSWRVLGVGLIGFSAVFFAPLRLGEVVRPYLLSEDGEVSFVQAVGSVAAERIIDGLAVALLTACALWLSTPISPLPNHVGALPIPVALVPGTVLFASLMFTGAFATIAFFYAAREQARRLVRAVIGVVSPRLAELCAGFVERLAEGFRFLPSWRSSGPFLRDTLLYWGGMGAAQYVLLRGVGLDCTAAQAFMTVGVIALGSLLPAGPGFFGAYQVAAYTSLAMFHPEQAVLTQGALFVFWSYCMHVLLNVLAGVVGFTLLSRIPANGS
jgi:uncharacterized protein (TIRG00374 family)